MPESYCLPGVSAVSQSSQNRSDVEIIPMTNILKLKVGSTGGGIDLIAVAKAEAALKALSGSFAEWLQDEIDKVEAARADIAATGLTVENARALYLCAHDLKGLGSTYEYPLVSRIAGSLCMLLEDSGALPSKAMKLVDAHIDTIKAVVRDGVKSETHPVGAVLAAELEGQVSRARDVA